MHEHPKQPCDHVLLLCHYCDIVYCNKCNSEWTRPSVSIPPVWTPPSPEPLKPYITWTRPHITWTRPVDPYDAAAIKAPERPCRSSHK